MQIYTQLTHEERYQTWGLQASGKSITAISEALNRHRSTISRELKRNSGLRGYRPKQAHHFAQARRKAKVTRRLCNSISKL